MAPFSHPESHSSTATITITINTTTCVCPRFSGPRNSTKLNLETIIIGKRSRQASAYHAYPPHPLCCCGELLQGPQSVPQGRDMRSMPATNYTYFLRSRVYIYIPYPPCQDGTQAVDTTLIKEPATEQANSVPNQTKRARSRLLLNCRTTCIQVLYTPVPLQRLAAFNHELRPARDMLAPTA